LRWRLSQHVTRKRRRVQDRRGSRWVTAAEVRIAIRPWQPSDGDDPLRVLASAPDAP
jgi:hypothetical protein